MIFFAAQLSPPHLPLLAQSSSRGRPVVGASPSSSSAACSARMTRRLKALHVSPLCERSTSSTSKGARAATHRLLQAVKDEVERCSSTNNNLNEVQSELGKKVKDNG